MEMLTLIGVLIVIVGFALKLENITIIMVAAFVTGLVGGMGIPAILETLGRTFVANRGMCIFFIVFFVTGTLERNGLKEIAAKLIAKIKNATAGMVVGAYGVLRLILAAFNVSLGGSAGFVRPVVVPMAIGAVEAKHGEPNEDHVEEIKGMGAGMENVTWFFGQVLFIGGAGGLLVQSTLANLGYETSLAELAAVEIPVAIFALIVAAIVYFLKDKRLSKKLYPNKK
jgi:uncharacterized membrane protein